jgi:hypothetical protein
VPAFVAVSCLLPVFSLLLFVPPVFALFVFEVQLAVRFEVRFKVRFDVWL